MFYRSSRFMYAHCAKSMTANYFEIYLFLWNSYTHNIHVYFCILYRHLPFFQVLFQSQTPFLSWLLIQEFPSVIQIERGSTEFKFTIRLQHLIHWFNLLCILSHLLSKIIIPKSVISSHLNIHPKIKTLNVIVPTITHRFAFLLCLINSIPTRYTALPTIIVISQNNTNPSFPVIFVLASTHNLHTLVNVTAITPRKPSSLPQPSDTVSK